MSILSLLCNLQLIPKMVRSYLNCTNCTYVLALYYSNHPITTVLLLLLLLLLLLMLLILLYIHITH